LPPRREGGERVRGPLDPSRPHPPSLSPRLLAIAGWSAFALAGALFLAIAWNVTARTALVALDGRVATWLHEHGTRGLTAFFFGVTNLHSPLAMAAWSAIFAAYLARLREWYWVLTLAASVGGGMLVNTFLKMSYERLRPHFDDPLLVLQSFSFPSGHTAGAVLFYGVLAAFLVSRFYDARRRAACVAGAVFAVMLVAFSRMYLGAHYLSDVVAAACASAVWLVLCLSAGHALVRGNLRLEWLGGAIVILLLVASAVLIPDEWWSRFEDAIESMHPLAALFVFCGAYALALLLLLPAWIFPLAAGAIFGFLGGLLAAELAVAASALAGWALARYVLRAWIERAARRSKTFKAIDHTVAKEPKKIVLLFRMTPAVPCGLKSYFLGLTRVRLGDYLLATVLGVAPDLAIKVYLGAAGRGALTNGGVANWALFAAGIAALIGLTLIVGGRLRARLAL
jgi:undecaprenyl-diphosphatase